MNKRKRNIAIIIIVVVAISAVVLALINYNYSKIDSIVYKAGTPEFSILENMKKEGIPLDSEFEYEVKDEYLFAVGIRPDGKRFYMILSGDASGNYTNTFEDIAYLKPATEALQLSIMPVLYKGKDKYILSIVTIYSLFPNKQEIVLKADELNLCYGDGTKLDKINIEGSDFAMYFDVISEIPKDFEVYANYEDTEYMIINADSVE